MGVNIGTYGYQNGRGNLLQQINYSRSAQDGPGEGEEDQEAEEAEDNDDQEELERDEEDPEDDDEEYDTQNEDDEQDADDEVDDEEADDVVDPEENELESYIRNANIDNSRIRARTAPLRPMEHVEQFKMTPNFKNLEQAAVCAVQIV